MQIRVKAQRSCQQGWRSRRSLITPFTRNAPPLNDESRRRLEGTISPGLGVEFIPLGGPKCSLRSRRRAYVFARSIFAVSKITFYDALSLRRRLTLSGVCQRERSLLKYLPHSGGFTEGAQKATIHVLSNSYKNRCCSFNNNLANYLLFFA